MKKNFRTVKASLIMGILLVSIFAVFAPSSSAAGLGLFNLTPEISLDLVDANKTVGIVPADPIPRIIELKVFYQITGILAQFAKRRFETAAINAQISISVGDVPDYCNAMIYPQLVQAPVLNQFEESIQRPKLQVTFLEHAPLNAQVNIPVTLRATVAPAFPWRVEEIERTFYVSVYPAYIPIIDAVPTETYKEIPPGEIANFEIELENKGNAETEFIFTIDEVPDDWTASIISNTKISSATLGGTSKKTVSLQIRPPYGFGYHDEEKTITLKVQGFYYADSGQTTSSRVYDIRVTVRNRGFSTPGFEGVFVLLALVGIAILLKKKKKIKSK